MIQADLHLMCGLGTIQSWAELALPTLAEKKNTIAVFILTETPRSHKMWCMNLFQHILTFCLFFFCFLLKTQYVFTENSTTFAGRKTV